MDKHPIQPLVKDNNGTVRFKENKIVLYLLNLARRHNVTLNDLAEMDFDGEDWTQFAQLTGYSLACFEELSYVDKHTYETAYKMQMKGRDEKDARIEQLEDTLRTIREGLKIATPAAFDIHPDDLDD